MAIVHDANAQSANTGASSLTFAHTVAVQNNRLLLVAVQNEQTNGSNGNQPVTGITYAGVAMTKIDAEQQVGGSDTDRSELWYLLAPATGANNVIITCTGSVAGLIGIATSYYGVKQQAHEVTGKASEENAGACAVAITPLSAGALVHASGCNGSAANTFTTGVGTERGNTSAAGIIDGAAASTILAGAPASTNISFTLGASSRWAIVSAAFAPQPTAPVGVKSKDGLAIASIKSFNGLVTASVKSVNGLA